MKIEYAISAGRGTLIDYGVADEVSLFAGAVYVRKPADVPNAPRGALIAYSANSYIPRLMGAAFGPCPDDCQTGQ